MKHNLLILILIGVMLLSACNNVDSMQKQLDTPSTILQKSETATQTDSTQKGQSETSQTTLTYTIVDTGVTDFYSDASIIAQPNENEAFYGQDAQYQHNMPSYTNNKDGTITDNVTGLMWQQTMDSKMTYDESFAYVQSATLAGYNDWRIPTIKELWSLMLYTGQSGGEQAGVLFIDTDYFDQPLGDTSIGEREIDAQVWSATAYVGQTMRGDATVFGVNFVDGRIKGYGTTDPRTKDDKKMYVRLVRGNEQYGINQFTDNHDGTISDSATGLMWQASDDGQTRNWEDALLYAQSADIAQYDDWRLPNAKELQSIVDYSKSPQTTQSAAIDDMFILTQIVDTKGQANYGFYWTSTTHLDGRNPYSSAVYVAFGEALGQMRDEVLDVHGAGALRSDPKSGDANDYPAYFGPQGDIQYVYNFVLLVRNINN